MSLDWLVGCEVRYKLLLCHVIDEKYRTSNIDSSVGLTVSCTQKCLMPEKTDAHLAPSRLGGLPTIICLLQHEEQAENIGSKNLQVTNVCNTQTTLDSC